MAPRKWFALRPGASECRFWMKCVAPQLLLEWHVVIPVPTLHLLALCDDRSAWLAPNSCSAASTTTHGQSGVNHHIPGRTPAVTGHHHLSSTHGFLSLTNSNLKPSVFEAHLVASYPDAQRLRLSALATHIITVQRRRQSPRRTPHRRKPATLDKHTVVLFSLLDAVAKSHKALLRPTGCVGTTASCH